MLEVPNQGMITRSKTLDKISSNHMENGADMPHSMKAMTIDKSRTNRSPVIERPHCPSHAPQEQLMLPTNGEDDQFSSEVISDTDLGEDDLSDSDSGDEWDDLQTNAV